MEGDPLDGFIQIPPQDTAQHTSEYVQAHYAPDSQQEAPVQLQPPVTSSPAPRTPSPPLADQVQWYPLPNREVNAPKPIIKNEVMLSTPNRAQTHYPPAPTSHTSSFRDYICEPAPMTDLTKYLVRREMVSSGLLKFDDCPQNYWTWKTSFQDVTRELSLTAREELGLLIKWLGPDSSPQAMRIRSVYVHNAATGVAMVWQRLDDSYGSPEVIEHALLSKLENFPKISNKDNQCLQELGDILVEIESAKSGGLLPGLAYLNTARGVNPIVEKPPYGLQERWITQGSKYKEEHKGSFPPFNYFISFITSQAKTRNDPSFSFSSSCATSQIKQHKPTEVFNNYKTVSVRKTEVPATPITQNNSSNEKKADEPADRCPMHNKPHPLDIKCTN